MVVGRYNKCLTKNVGWLVVAVAAIQSIDSFACHGQYFGDNGKQLLTINVLSVLYLNCSDSLTLIFHFFLTRRKLHETRTLWCQG